MGRQDDRPLSAWHRSDEIIVQSPASSSRYSRPCDADEPRGAADADTFAFAIALHHRRVSGERRHEWTLASGRDAGHSVTKR